MGRDNRIALKGEMVLPGIVGLFESILRWRWLPAAERGSTIINYERYQVDNSRNISTTFDPSRKSNGWEANVYNTYNGNAVVGLSVGSDHGVIDNFGYSRRFVGWEAMRKGELAHGWQYGISGRMRDGWVSQDTISGMTSGEAANPTTPWLPPFAFGDAQVDTANQLRRENWELLGSGRLENPDVRVPILGIKIPAALAIDAHRQRQFRLEPVSTYKGEVTLGPFSFGYSEILNLAPEVQSDGAAEQRSYRTDYGINLPLADVVSKVIYGESSPLDISLNFNYWRIANANYDSHLAIDNIGSRKKMDGVSFALRIGFGKPHPDEVAHVVHPANYLLPIEVSPNNQRIMYEWYKRKYANTFGGEGLSFNDASLTRREVRSPRLSAAAVSSTVIVPSIAPAPAPSPTIPTAPVVAAPPAAASRIPPAAAAGSTLSTPSRTGAARQRRQAPPAGRTSRTVTGGKTP